MQAFDSGLVFHFGQIQRFFGDAPHAATERLTLLDRNHIAGTILPATLAQDSPVKGELITVAVTLEVVFKPAQIIAGFQVDDPEPAAIEVHADLAGFIFVICPDHAFRDSVRQKLLCFRMQPDSLLKFCNKSKIFSGDNSTALSFLPFGIGFGGLSETLTGNTLPSL